MRKQKTKAKGKGAQKVKPNALLGYFYLLRPVNALMVGVAGVVAAVISSACSSCAVFAVLSAVFISAAAQAVNDYYDYPIDSRKNRKKPLIHWRMPRKHALYISAVLYALGIAFAFLASPLHAILAVVASVTTYAYSAYLRNLKYVGNLLVALSVAFVFPFVGFCGFVYRTWFPALLIFLSMWAREIMKDIEDLDVDYGYKTTLPMIAGKDMSAYLSAYFLLLAVFFSVFAGPWGFGIFGWWYYYILVPAALLFMLSGYYIVRDEAGRAQILCKVGMLVSLAAFAAGVLI